MITLLYMRESQTFEFITPGTLNLPPNSWHFSNIEGGEFTTENGSLDLLKILNFITGYNLKLVEGETKVLRNGSEKRIVIAEVYAPHLRDNISQKSDEASKALTRLLKELSQRHSRQGFPNFSEHKY